MALVLEGKSIGSDRTKKECSKENQESGYGPKVQYNSKGFDLLQISPNWTLDPRLKWALE
jgi:hypothetical protein